MSVPARATGRALFFGLGAAVGIAAAACGVGDVVFDQAAGGQNTGGSSPTCDGSPACSSGGGAVCDGSACGDGGPASDDGSPACDGSLECAACTTEADCLTYYAICGSACAILCSDGQQDGYETDVDCGGGVCAPCAPGKMCKVAADCASGSCAQVNVMSYVCW
jgi:hypothetical protein